MPTKTRSAARQAEPVTKSETALRPEAKRTRPGQASTPSIRGAREPLKSVEAEAKRKTPATAKPAKAVPEAAAADVPAKAVAKATASTATASKAKATKSAAPAKASADQAASSKGAPGKPAQAKAPAATKPAATPAKPPVREVDSASKKAAAAFFAARKKMAPAVAPAAPAEIHDASKGTVQVTDKKVRPTTLDDAAAAPAAPNPAPAAPAPVAMAPSPMGGRPFSAAPRGPIIRPRPAPGGKKESFKTGEFIVYPAHGVGQITATESQEVAGYKLELFVISFAKDKMILKVPLPKITSVGMRKLAEPAAMKRALDTLTGRARIKRTMWSRRAQEYEAKINSGDLIAIAEVVRDLYRSDAQPEQSYSERQLYEAALDRMARELAAVQKLTDTEALKLIDDQLQKGPRRGKVEDAEADEAEDAEEGGIGEAA